MTIVGKKKIPEVQDLLQRYGPSTSSFLARKLEEAGATTLAARQRVSRAKDPVFRLDRIRFPHRGQFLYLGKQRFTEDFTDRLAEAVQTTSSSYGVALRALNARGGIIPASLFHTYSGSPMRLKGHVGSDRILGDLLYVGLVEKTDLAGVGEVISARGMQIAFNDSANLMRARLKAEQIVLQGLKDWLRKLGLVSYESVQVRGDQGRKNFGQFEWDLTAPSYIYPLTSYSREEKKLVGGFFVADVLCVDDLRAADAQFFVNKFEIMKSGRRTRPFMAMLVANRFEKESFRAMKQKGFLVTSVENIFGEDVAEALRTLVRVLSDAAAAVATSPEKLDTLIGTLSKIEGASLNVRSDLFEVIVGYCMKEAEGGSVDLRLIVEDPKEGGRAEIDVLSKKRDAVTVIECKGIKRGNAVSRAEVEEWFTKKVPRIRNFLLSKHDLAGRDLEFAMWTTGGFEPEAVAYLEERKIATKKYVVAWKDRAALMEWLSKKKLKQIKDMIENHY